MADNNAPSIFDSLRENLRSITDTVTNSDTVQRAALAGMKPEQVIDTLVEKGPKGADGKPDPTMAKFATIAKSHPEFASALKDALVQDETMLPGLKSMTAGGTGGTFKSMVDAMEDNNNVELFTGVLKVTAKSPSFNFNDVQNTVELAKKANGKDATKDDYANLDRHLKGIGIRDPRLEMAQDPMKMLNMLWEDPKGATKMISNMMGNSMTQMGLSPDVQNQITGALSWVIQYISAFTNPNGEMLKPFVESGQLIAKGAKQSGEEINRGPGVVETPESGRRVRLSAIDPVEQRAEAGQGVTQFDRSNSYGTTIALNGEPRLGREVFERARSGGLVQPENDDLAFKPKHGSPGLNMVG